MRGQKASVRFHSRRTEIRLTMLLDFVLHPRMAVMKDILTGIGNVSAWLKVAIA